MTRRLLALSVITCFGMAISTANAGLVHEYTFNDGTANDSVGGAHGTLSGAATPTVAGGRLTTFPGGNENSYVLLPTDIAKNAAAGGTVGAFSFEVWSQANTNGHWRTVVSLGGEGGTDGNGGDNDYVQIIAEAGNGTNSLRATTHQRNEGTEGAANYSAALSTTADQHMVVVIDQSGPTLPGTISFYVDGALTEPPVDIAPGLDFLTMANDRNYLGRSAWNDDNFDGSFDEFRIYDHALSALEVADSFADGATIPEPATLALFATASIAMLVRRRIVG